MGSLVIHQKGHERRCAEKKSKGIYGRVLLARHPEFPSIVPLTHCPIEGCTAGWVLLPPCVLLAHARLPLFSDDLCTIHWDLASISKYAGRVCGDGLTEMPIALMKSCRPRC